MTEGTRYAFVLSEFTHNKMPTQALTVPAKKKIDKIDMYYATAQAGVNIKK